MWRLLAMIGAFNLLLVAPLWWRFSDVSGQLIGWEAWLVVPGLLLLPRGAMRWVASLAWLAAVVLITLLNLGDAGTFTAFGRPFNSYLDIPLAVSVYELLAGNLGTLVAILVLLAGLLLLIGIFVVLAVWLLKAPRLMLSSHCGQVAVAISFTAAVLISLELGGTRLIETSRVPMVNTATFQWQQLTRTHAATQAFKATLERTPIMTRALPGLAESQVLLTFIESYGQTAIEDPRYNTTVLESLADMQRRLDGENLHVVSGWLTSPIRGGQSWLAHATALSGRWIDNQMWYQLMLDTGHSTLVDDFSATGHRTMTVMPAITRAWPEGKAYGFDDLLVADRLGYQGPPLHWVTMPDQYTLDVVSRRFLGEAPVFAQLALISSHAPWTPILPVLDDWSLIGNGEIFAPWENAGDPPDVLWQDLERIRDHYGWSVGYSVAVSGQWAARRLDEDSLLILLGDHQPAPLITGNNGGMAVPVHVISGDPQKLTPFVSQGFIDGTRPPAIEGMDVARMDRLRHWLQDAFGPAEDPESLKVEAKRP